MTAPRGLEAALADRYRIERELGQGGMATVYLAHDLKHDRTVAIKVLWPGRLSCGGVLGRLRRWKDPDLDPCVIADPRASLASSRSLRSMRLENRHTGEILEIRRTRRDGREVTSRSVSLLP